MGTRIAVILAERRPRPSAFGDAHNTMINSLRLETATSPIELRDWTWTVRVKRLMKTTMCLLNGGHWQVRHFTRERMALRCVACGHESPGWHVDRRA
jgi:hypothetical protein